MMRYKEINGEIKIEEGQDIYILLSTMHCGEPQNYNIHFRNQCKVQIGIMKPQVFDQWRISKYADALIGQ